MGKNYDFLKRTDLSVNDDFLKPDLTEVEKELNEAFEEKERREQEAIQRDIERTEYARQTAENTSYLPAMLWAVREGNEINREVLDLHKEMLNVLTAESKKEAESMVTEIANKAKNTNDSINTAISLYKHGNSLIQFMSNAGLFG
ncbi:hypothetical protein J0K78_04970 [Halobacillus sp. GSS1]|uniref:hypothetical protein n=1 Tax=Halobacillus sp. GSS1 TaxID=2815919 RepID=UPI001A8DECE0|nr:hypothetical protein [Halobacillus sp. GSS1]MBN9653612.1 hypothetical protein [Halobacillus sp. GSS1]